MKFIFEFINILTSKQKYNLLIIQSLIIIMSLFELASIISIAPFMAILTDPNLIFSNQYLYFFYKYFNFTSQNNFLIFISIIDSINIHNLAFIKIQSTCWS